MGTLGNARALQWMAQHVPGVHVPTEVIERVGAASDPRAEGQRLCLETIERLRQIDGVAAARWERRSRMLVTTVTAASGRPFSSIRRRMREWDNSSSAISI